MALKFRIEASRLTRDDKLVKAITSRVKRFQERKRLRDQASDLLLECNNALDSVEVPRALLRYSLDPGGGQVASAPRTQPSQDGTCIAAQLDPATAEIADKLHPVTARLCGELGSVLADLYADKKSQTEARDKANTLLRIALRARKRVFGEAASDTTTTQTRLGRLIKVICKQKQSDIQKKRSSEGTEIDKKTMREEIAACRVALTEAKAMLAKAAATRERVCGGLQAARSLTHLGTVAPRLLIVALCMHSQCPTHTHTPSSLSRAAARPR